MLAIEIPHNPNCEPVELRVFHDLEPPRPVSQVRLERGPGLTGPQQWCAITGWTLAGTPCPALARKVDDSGEGVIFLISGGDAGLRLKPSGDPAAWSVDHPAQWGEPFLLIPDAEDLRAV